MKPASCHPDKKHYSKRLCRDCYNVLVARPRANAWYAQNKEKARFTNKVYVEKHADAVKRYKATWAKNRSPIARVNAHLLSRYGINTKQFDELFIAQGGVCKICLRTNGKKRLCVDHCHKTGKVRGLLCNSCNTLVGYVENNEKLLPVVQVYLHGK